VGQGFESSLRTSTYGVCSGVAETQEMLNFCAKKNILPDCEIIPIQEINKAFDRMERGDVRYRFVIDMSSLDGQVAQSE
jgi:uncharacterized zinc-type alcohol dehydrogenase-like protein